MLILAGLGNPGSQYAGNRHNIGFMAIDAMARHHGFGPFRSRFQGLVSEGSVGSERVLLLKPTTFMNDSGRSLAETGRFYKIDVASFVVIHDELDLEPAKLRVKVGGGNAGHNGLRSITALCGNDYKRVRLGIGHPGDRTLVYNYVLSDFARDERPWVTTLCDSVAKDAALLVKGEDATFQNKVFGAMKAAGLAAA